MKIADLEKNVAQDTNAISMELDNILNRMRLITGTENEEVSIDTLFSKVTQLIDQLTKDHGNAIAIGVINALIDGTAKKEEYEKSINSKPPVGYYVNKLLTVSNQLTEIHSVYASKGLFFLVKELKMATWLHRLMTACAIKAFEEVDQSKNKE